MLSKLEPDVDAPARVISRRHSNSRGDPPHDDRQGQARLWEAFVIGLVHTPLRPAWPRRLFFFFPDRSEEPRFKIVEHGLYFCALW